MLYILHEDELKECTLAKEDKTRSRKDDFLQILLWTSGQQRVSRQRYMLRTTTHAEYDKANKLVLFFVL